jgi:hypothetical protein
MEAQLVNATERFARRDAAPDPELATICVALERERQARLRAEREITELTRYVAREGRRAQLELERRLEAEAIASDMAALVAAENARANAAEQQLRDRS